MTELPAVATPPAPPFCGRQTKGGKPCRQRITDPRFEVACRTHSTDHERELAAARRDAYYQGYLDAQQSGVAYANSRIEQLEQHIATLEKRAKPPRRMIDERGRQVVQIGRYAYAWVGAEPLNIGDQVWVPENYVSRARHGPGAYIDTVTDLGTDYTGPLAEVARRA